MKYLYHILIIVLFVNVFSYNASAQQMDENTYLINRYFQIASSGQNLLTENELLVSKAKTNNLVNNTELNILQAGNYNSINVKTSTNTQNVNQVGDYNNYEFISFYGRNDLNLEVQQIGNQNFVQILGENSLIDNMKIIQKSNFKTITITNY